MRNALLALFLGAPCFAAAAAAPKAAPATPAQASAATPPPNGFPAAAEDPWVLTDALSAIDQPKMRAVFGYVASQYSAMAFADYLVGDSKALKRYVKKISADRRLVGGLTQWDHNVCVVLVNRFEAAAEAEDRPSASRLSEINQCLLSRVANFQEILMRRKQ